MYKVIKRSGSVFGNEPYTCEFVCDTASDILTLPTSTTVGTGGKTEYDNQVCGSGSIATIAADDAESKKYILNNQDVWCPQLSNTNVIPVASTDTLGGVMVDGTSITANEQGVISAVGSELPVASTDTLGGVMVDGTSITADENGVISAIGGSGSDDWTNVGTVTISGGNKSTEFSIPNLSNYKFMMLSISVPSYSGSKWNSSNYTRILVLDDYRLPSDGGLLKYYIGDDATSTSSSSTVHQYVCSMTIDKSTNKVIFFGQSSCYANIYMK